MTPDPALALLAGLILEDGRRWGEAAEPWQWADAMSVLCPGGNDPRLHWLGRPKGGSKSTDLAGMGIAWLVKQAPPAVEGFAVAADEEQANRLLDKARGFIRRTPGLRRHVAVQAHRIVGPDGARIQTLAADVASSEGLLTPFIMVDELPNWASTPTARGMWTSVVSSLPKWPYCRLVVIGHASDPSHWSYALLESARSSPAWRVNEVPGPLPWVSPDALEVQRSLLLPSAYARRHLNVWTAPEEALTTLDDVRACITHAGRLPPRPGVRYAIGVDLGVRRDRTAIVVCHAEPAETRWAEGREIGQGTRIVVDQVQTWKPGRLHPVDLTDVEAWLIEAHRRYFKATIRADVWQMIAMIQRLRGQGVDVEEARFSPAANSRRAGLLYQLLRDRSLGLPDDEEFVGELVSVRILEPNPGVYRIDHTASTHDDQVQALGLAAETLLEHPPATPLRMEFWRDERLAGRGRGGPTMPAVLRERLHAHYLERDLRYRRGHEEAERERLWSPRARR